MSDVEIRICGDQNPHPAGKADGLGLCIRGTNHPFVHRDSYGQTWPLTLEQASVPDEPECPISVAGAQRIISEVRAELEGATERIEELQAANESLRENQRRLVADNDELRVELGVAKAALETANRTAGELHDMLAMCEHDSPEESRANPYDDHSIVRQGTAVMQHEEMRTKLAAELEDEAGFEDGPPEEPRAEAAQMSAAEAYRLVEELRDTQELNAGHLDTIETLRTRLRYVLCVDHAGAVLPRCAKCLYDQTLEREAAIKAEEDQARRDREDIERGVGRLTTQSVELIASLGEILSEAVPMIRKGLGGQGDGR